MSPNEILKEIKGIDVYLMDQFLKENIRFDYTILDAGCGSGRNIHWLIKNNAEVYGVDEDVKRISDLKTKYPNHSNNFSVSSIEKMDFQNETFDFIICNAVLHFARSHEHFNRMFKELVRLMKPKGVLFIRMTSNIGIEKKIESKGEGVYVIPDGSTRYLINRQRIEELVNEYSLVTKETVKSVNVDGVRIMTTLVLEKK